MKDSNSPDNNKSVEYCRISLKPVKGNERISGYNNTAVKSLFGSMKIEPALSFSRSDFFQNSVRYTRGMSISGVQQKLSIKEDSEHRLVPTERNGLYILKPSPEAFPYAAENEHAAMSISRMLGIETALCGLVSFTIPAEAGSDNRVEEELAYITKRFDRLADGNKQHQEDLLQCFGLEASYKYSKTYEEAGRMLKEVTNGKQAVIFDFIRRVLFAYVIGNDDMHLKNISVQRLPDNRTPFYDKLTPNYDCLFCDPFTPETTGMKLLALRLLYDPDDGDEAFTEAYNRYGYYTGADFLELSRRLDLRDQPILSFIKKLNEKKPMIHALIQTSFMPDDMKKRANDLISERLRAINNL